MKFIGLFAGLLLPLSVMTGLSRAALSPEDLYALLRELPKHNSFAYVTWGALPEEYFEAARRSLEDPYLYIVLSDTGSPAGRLIGLFTGAAYNHVSLSFDPALDTLVSYNGGNGVSGPGLNREALADLNRKPGASLAVFRLGIGPERKRALMGRVAAINREGSSYNLLGLVTKTSLRPNIMFCSQFVYTMLEEAGAAYFDKKSGDVRPTDFLLKTLDGRSITSYNLIQQVRK
jgi:hypothetical protein